MAFVRLGVLPLAFLLWLSPTSAQDLTTLLSNFVASGDRAERELILLKISEQHPEAGAALLKIAAQTTDTETKWLAIRGIGSLRYKQAGPFLKEWLHSNSAYVRANSARALGDIRDGSAVRDLISLLSLETDDGVLQQTSVALEMLDAKEAIPALMAKSGVPSADTRLWMMGAVEALGSKDVSFFASFLCDQSWFVASYAAHAIARITKQDFGFPHCGPGVCSDGDGVENVRRWWKQNH
jgi:HEAT repeat protein